MTTPGIRSPRRSVIGAAAAVLALGGGSPPARPPPPPPGAGHHPTRRPARRPDRGHTRGQRHAGHQPGRRTGRAGHRHRPTGRPDGTRHAGPIRSPPGPDTDNVQQGDQTGPRHRHRHGPTEHASPALRVDRVGGHPSAGRTGPGAAGSTRVNVGGSVGSATTGRPVPRRAAGPAPTRCRGRRRAGRGVRTAPRGRRKGRGPRRPHPPPRPPRSIGRSRSPCPRRAGRRCR